MYLYVVYTECNDKDVVEGQYFICSFNRLTPVDPDCEEGIGGLTHLSFSVNALTKKLKSSIDEEEICGAMACQCPRTREIKWIKCEASKCDQWFHLECAGYKNDCEQLPRKWFCGCSKFKESNCFR